MPTVPHQRRHKPLFWLRSSYKDYIAFPEDVQDDAGHQLELVQRGLDPLDFQPMPEIGPGVIEIRVDEDRETYRVFYVARFEEAVYILHAFKKKSKKGKATPKHDLEVARQRYKNLINYRASARRR